MRIALASDHAGTDLRRTLAAWLREDGHQITDLGSDGPDPVDYPDLADSLADALLADGADRGIAVCGTGIGISIGINRHRHCRAALVSDPYSAALAREHNDANVLALGARLIGLDMAKACVAAFLITDFAGGRHERRVAKLGRTPDRSPA